MIKLLALDLDGTLLDPQGKISSANRKAIREAEHNGVLVTIATGRRFRDALPVALELDLNAPIITHNGALIKFADTLDAISVSLLQPDVSGEVIRVGRELGGDALVSTQPEGHGSLFYERISEGNLPLQKYIRWAESLHGTAAGQGLKHVEDLGAVLPNTSVIHISYSGQCSAMERMANELRTEFGDRITLLQTIYTALDFTLLDILPAGSSKGSGVEKLASISGLLPEHVMAIGDNFNDIEMLEYAGTPILMGNAAEGLRAERGYHRTLSNAEDGVARAIERFILA